MSCDPRGQGGGFSGRNQWREPPRLFRHRRRQAASRTPPPDNAPRSLKRCHGHAPVFPTAGERQAVRCSIRWRRRLGPGGAAIPSGRALVLRTEPRRSRDSALCGLRSLSRIPRRPHVGSRAAGLRGRRGAAWWRCEGASGNPGIRRCSFEAHSEVMSARSRSMRRTLAHGTPIGPHGTGPMEPIVRFGGATVLKRRVQWTPPVQAP